MSTDVEDSEIADLPNGVGRMVFLVAFWLEEYAGINSSKGGLGHAGYILEAERIRNDLIENLQQAFSKIKEPELDLLRELSLRYILWCYPDRSLEKDKLMPFVDEALAVANGNMGQVVSVYERFRRASVPIRPVCNPVDMYDGPVKACIDLPWSLG